MTPNSYSGRFGIVLFIDAATGNKAMELSASCNGGNSIDLSGKHESHVTLYHSKFSDVPREVIEAALKDIASRLPCELEFTDISSFGGKFLFWKIERTPLLFSLHEKTVKSLSKYFVREGEQQTDREKAILSGGERQNVEKYGHPFVGKFWNPHVTLGYYAEGAPAVSRSEKHLGKAVAAAFVKVGEWGTIAEVVSKVF